LTDFYAKQAELCVSPRGGGPVSRRG